MIKRMLLMIAIVVVIVGGMIGFKMMMAAGTKQFLAAQPVPAQTVSTAVATAQDWRQEIDAVGTLRSVNGADLSFEVPGIIETLPFESGSDVEKGEVLAHINADDDVAQLHSLEATAKLAQITLERDMKQIKAQAVSQATIDADTASLDNAKAQVDVQKATVDKKTLHAPFAGHLGIRQADIGQYVNAGMAVVTLQQLDPIYIDFNLPEQELTHVSVEQKVAAHADALPGLSFEGEISAINAKIDEATRNVSVRATFKNADRKLLPGMFAHVSITTGEPQKLVTLPQTAITFNPYGNTVFLVAKDDAGKPVAKQSFVTTGAVRGDQVSVLSGVKEGDEVVTSGQLKIRNATPLVINNEIQPKDEEKPEVKDK